MTQFNATLTAFTNSTTVKPSGYARSMFSNGTNSSALVFAPTSNPLRINTPFTFDWWGRVDTTGRRFCGSGVVASNDEWWMQHTGTNQLMVTTFGNGKNLTSLAGSFTLTTFHHIRYDFDGTTYRLYIDGTYQAAIGGGAINEAAIGGTPTGYIGCMKGNTASCYTTEFAVFNGSFTTHPTNLGDVAFTPPSAPWNNSLNGLTHLYHMDPSDPSGAGVDSADQNFTAPSLDPSHPITITPDGTEVDVPAGAVIQGSYPVTGSGGLKLYRGTSPGAELTTPVATITGAWTGSFTGLTPAASGTNYWYTVKAFDNEPFPAFSGASNEVASTAGGPVIPLTPSGSGSALRRTYVDTLHGTIPFNNGSYFLLPWRAYMDTWSVKRYADSLGFNPGTIGDTSTRYDWVMNNLMATAGMKRIRVDCNYGTLVDFTGNIAAGTLASLNARFAIIKTYGGRPLLLFDFNNGQPVPSRTLNVNVVTAATTGQQTLVVDNTLDFASVRPYYTGWRTASPDSSHPPGKPLITGISGPDGSGHYTLTFYSNLPANVSVGAFALQDLYAAPLASSTSDGGAANARAADAYAKIQAGAKLLFDLATSYFGPDGWDVEIINELTSLSAGWVNITNTNTGTYGVTSLSAPVYTGTSPLSLGVGAGGNNCVVAAIADVVRNPANGYGDVMVVNGASNQTPFYYGAGLFPGVDANSRHDYTGGIYVLPKTMATSGIESEARASADGTPDGTVTGGGTDGGSAWGTVTAGTYFVPTLNCCYPEHKFAMFEIPEADTKELIPSLSLQTVKVETDVHGRFSQNVKNPRRYRMVQTENAYDRGILSGAASTAAGLSFGASPQAAVVAFDNQLAAKIAARTFTFFCGKGQYAEYMFASSGNPGSASGSAFNLIPDGYATGGSAGEVPRVMGNILTFMKGSDGLADFGVCRYLGVSSVLEYNPQLVFAGGADQTKNPDMYHRDFLAILPFQSSLRRFVIPIYVCHPDMSKVWDTSKGFLDIARYTMTPQQFDITFTNVQGTGATVRLYDPTLNTYTTPTITASTATTLTVRLTVTDQPRLLEVVEAQDGPSLQSVAGSLTSAGALAAKWTSNCPVTVTAGDARSTRNARTALASVSAGTNAANDAAGQSLKLTATNAAGIVVDYPHYNDDSALVRQFTALGPSVTLTGVSGSTSTSAGLINVRTAWPADPNALSYTLYKDGSPLVDGLTTNSYTETGVTPDGSTHAYQVETVDAQGNRVRGSAFQLAFTAQAGSANDRAVGQVIYQDDLVLQYATSYTLDESVYGQKTLTWAASGSAFLVLRGQAGAPPLVVARLPSGASSFTDRTLPSGPLHYVVVALP